VTAKSMDAIAIQPHRFQVTSTDGLRIVCARGDSRDLSEEFRSPMD
jgi:hypothetical protein